MTADPVQLLLRQLRPESLHDLVGEERLTQILSVLRERERESAERDSEALAAVASAMFGTQLLEDPRVRSQVLALVSPEELQRLADDFAGQSFDKPADNILALAALPWKPGSPLALEVVRRFGLPVTYLPRTVPPAPAATVVRPSPKRPGLRGYQREVKERILSLVDRQASRILVQMPTGAGKTRTTMDTLVELAAKHALFASGRSILWLAHVEELCDQAVSSFEDSWMECGDTPATVVRAWGSQKPNLADYAGAFIVGTYQKFVALRKQKREFEHIRRAIRVVVTDEAHKVLAPTFRSLLDELLSDDVLLIGLTATPGRGLDSGPENVQLAGFFHKNLVSPEWSDNPIRDLRNQGILAALRHRSIDSDAEVTLTAAERAAALEIDLPGTVLNRLAWSASRNRRIVDAIHEELKLERPCLVFACTVEHSRMLAAVLNIEGAKAAHVDSSLSRTQRRDIIAGFRDGEINVLLNFGVLSTGFDVPRVSAVVIARPTTSVVLYSQMIGRGLRGPASGGERECSLIDVRDNFIAFGAVDDVYKAFAPYWE